MNMTKLGAFLQTLRREHGLTQEQLGEQLGVTGKTVSRWETGAYTPPVDILLSLSQRYGVTINELLAGERLSPEAAPEKAEENLTAVLRQNAIFELKERKDFWLRKWQRDHRWIILLLYLPIAALQIIGMVTETPQCILAGMAFTLALVMWINNARAGYVEHHLYDENLAERNKP